MEYRDCATLSRRDGHIGKTQCRPAYRHQLTPLMYIGKTDIPGKYVPTLGGLSG